MTPERHREIIEKARQAEREYRKEHGPPPESVLRAIAGILRSHHQSEAEREQGGRSE